MSIFHNNADEILPGLWLGNSQSSQDEVFLRLNESWAGKQGYDQNRAVLGLEVKTKIKNTPVTFNVGYMNVHTPTKMSHGINVGVRINIPSKKK